MSEEMQDRVSRRRYERERRARAEAEALLEQKSRALFLANRDLAAQSQTLEQSVARRTGELREALAHAERAALARSRFLATMSHEIRTPLGGLIGMIDLLGWEETDPAKQELLEHAKSAGLGLSRIVNDVLDFSKMDAGDFVFEEESVDLRGLVESVRVLVSSDKGAQEREIRIEIAETVPHLFLGDATRIRQVILNLMTNALRYSSAGPVILRADACDHAKGVLLRVEVQDFGVGIAPQQIAHVFKDFTQVSNPLTAAAQGTGLGLAICKGIINGSGGTISVDSHPGEGATFWFELPVQIAARRAPCPEPVVCPAVPDRLVGRRILIAEDNVINQKLLLAYAARLKLQVDLAANGRIALEIFDPGAHDLVIMDVAMPEMDGLEATRRLRATWGAARLPPIIALSAHVKEAIDAEARKVGIQRILSKPVSLGRLKQAMEDALSAPVDPQMRGSRPGPGRAPAQDVVQLMCPEVAESLLGIFSPQEIARLAADFVSDCSTRLSALRAAGQTGAAETVRAQAHSLKGAAITMGFVDMADWAGRIAQAEPQGDAACLAQNVQAFENRLEEIATLLRASPR